MVVPAATAAASATAGAATAGPGTPAAGRTWRHGRRFCWREGKGLVGQGVRHAEQVSVAEAAVVLPCFCKGGGDGAGSEVRTRNVNHDAITGTGWLACWEKTAEEPLRDLSFTSSQAFSFEANRRGSIHAIRRQEMHATRTSYKHREMSQGQNTYNRSGQTSRCRRRRGRGRLGLQQHQQQRQQRWKQGRTYAIPATMCRLRETFQKCPRVKRCRG